MRLKGRKILITGAANGIGEATARLFAKEGAKLALLDIQGNAVRTVARAVGGTPLEADVRDAGSVKQAVNDAARALGGINGIVNCAGIADASAFHEVTLDVWEDVIRTNLTGTFLVCRAALPFLKKAKNATIVNLASGQALLPTGASDAYAASKGGVLLFSRNLSVTLAPKIRVNVVCPGTTETPMVAAVKKASPATIQTLLSSVPFGRLGAPSEQATTILFLTGDESSFVTGAALAVDGGRTRH